MSTEMQVIEGSIDAELLADLTVRRPPELVLEEARRAAVCLKDVLETKSHKVMMNDEQYLEFEDWQTVGKFYGVTCGQDDDPQHAPKVEYVELGGVRGFKATCVALHNSKVISRATAFCLTDEEKWGERNKYAYAYCTKSGGTSIDDPGPAEIIWIPNPNKPGRSMPKKERILVGTESVPLFQLASMAQTRANAKALRNVLSWVVVLAGYKPTPAEELPSAKHVEQPHHEAAMSPGHAAPDILSPDKYAGEVRGEWPSQPSVAVPPSLVHGSVADSKMHMQDYISKAKLSQSVRECSEVGNAAEADQDMNPPDLKAVRAVVSARMQELGKAK